MTGDIPVDSGINDVSKLSDVSQDIPVDSGINDVSQTQKNIAPLVDSVSQFQTPAAPTEGDMAYRKAATSTPAELTALEQQRAAGAADFQTPAAPAPGESPFASHVTPEMIAAAKAKQQQQQVPSVIAKPQQARIARSTGVFRNGVELTREQMDAMPGVSATQSNRLNPNRSVGVATATYTPPTARPPTARPPTARPPTAPQEVAPGITATVGEITDPTISDERPGVVVKNSPPPTAGATPPETPTTPQTQEEENTADSYRQARKAAADYIVQQAKLDADEARQNAQAAKETPPPTAGATPPKTPTTPPIPPPTAPQQPPAPPEATGQTEVAQAQKQPNAVGVASETLTKSIADLRANIAAGPPALGGGPAQARVQPAPIIPPSLTAKSAIAKAKLDKGPSAYAQEALEATTHAKRIPGQNAEAARTQAYKEGVMTAMVNDYDIIVANEMRARSIGLPQTPKEADTLLGEMLGWAGKSAPALQSYIESKFQQMLSPSVREAMRVRTANEDARAKANFELQRKAGEAQIEVWTKELLAEEKELENLNLIDAHAIAAGRKTGAETMAKGEATEALADKYAEARTQRKTDEEIAKAKTESDPAVIAATKAKAKATKEGQIEAEAPEIAKKDLKEQFRESQADIKENRAEYLLAFKRAEDARTTVFKLRKEIRDETNKDTVKELKQKLAAAEDNLNEAQTEQEDLWADLTSNKTRAKKLAQRLDKLEPEQEQNQPGSGRETREQANQRAIDREKRLTEGQKGDGGIAAPEPKQQQAKTNEPDKESAMDMDKFDQEMAESKKGVSKKNMELRQGIQNLSEKDKEVARLLKEIKG